MPDNLERGDMAAVALDRIVQDTRHRRFKPRSAVHDEQRESDEVSDESDQRNKSFEKLR